MKAQVIGSIIEKRQAKSSVHKYIDMISISILFSGRGTNAESILKSIITKDLNFKVKKVICNNSHADGIIKLKI